MFSGVLRQSGMRVYSDFEHRGDDLLRRVVGIDRHHLGAVDHHVGDRQIAQVEQPAQHVAVVLLHAAFAVQQIDRAADFLVRRHDRLVLADLDAERAQEPFHQPLDRDQHRAENPDDPGHRPRDRQRDALRRADRHGLRQHLGEHDDDDASSPTVA